MIPVTIGICAYNEAGNIERSVLSVFEQKLPDVVVDQVIVVSSGSTDGTDDIVRRITETHPSVVLIPQEKREGKNSAINLMLDNVKTEIVVLLNADNAFGNEDSLNNLISYLKDEKVGIVGGHPIPTNDKNTVAGFAAHLIWEMHHHVATIYPKIGELVAFRDIGTRLPLKTQSDEDILRMELEKKGFVSMYAPDAIIMNRGPETVQDFIKQRTRVNIGERYMKRDFDYDIPTWDKGLLFEAILCSIKSLGFHPLKLIAGITLEIYSKIKAIAYVHANKGDMSVWDQVTTTKKL